VTAAAISAEHAAFPQGALAQSWLARTDRALKTALQLEVGAPPQLAEAMRYAGLVGGKRIRPFLVYASGYALGADPRTLDAAACAVELVHAYSLVHDDLPAMDNDDFRRGRPTTHRAFGEANAILAGDALHTLAFAQLAKSGLPSDVRIRMVEVLADALGAVGMAGGQAIDLALTGKDATLNILRDMHTRKTGALIRAATRMGCCAARPTSDPQAQAMDRYAKALGLAFQVWDDVLDVTGDLASLGKDPGSDLAANKATFVRLLGLAEARTEAKRLCDEALAALTGFDQRAEPLRSLAHYVIQRDH
jgi:farnesyl diphosphate synthase